MVAAKALKPGTLLQAADLKTIPWPAEQLPKRLLRDRGPSVGNTVFDPIGEGEPVMTSQLATAQSGGGAGVPEGMRAVSVHVTDSTGVLALLRAGQKVDVQVVVRRKEAAARHRSAHGAGESDGALGAARRPEQSSQGQTLPVVTLLAKPADADVLAAADSGARVRLTLRNPLDKATRARAPLTLDAVMRASGAAPADDDRARRSGLKPRGARTVAAS